MKTMDPSDHELWRPGWGGGQCAHTKKCLTGSQNILTWSEPTRTNSCSCTGHSQDHTTSLSTPDAHHPYNIHQTLEPGLSSEFNHHGTLAGMDSCGEKTPKDDIVTTVPWPSCCLEHLDSHREDWKTWLVFVHLGEAQGHIS